MPQCILTVADAVSLQILAESFSKQRDPVANQIWEKLTSAMIVPVLEIECDRVTIDSGVTFETSDGLVHTVRIVDGPHSIAREAVLPLEHSRAIALIGSQTGDRVLAIDRKGCFELLVVNAVKQPPKLAGEEAVRREDRIVLLKPITKGRLPRGTCNPRHDDPGPTAA
jgi:transcription elongation GreA/GreB family factor